MTIQEAKDTGAQLAGYKDWNEMFELLKNGTIAEAKNSQLEYAIDKAIEVYAKQKNKTNI